MTAMRFESRRDLWLVAVLRLMPVFMLLIVGGSWYGSGRDIRGPLAGAIILIIVEVFFFESLLRSTYYLVERPDLIIRSSFFTWRVPIAEIRTITPTRNPLSSPALSLDRLLITYGAKQIMVSPEEKQRFIDSLRSINPSIVA